MKYLIAVTIALSLSACASTGSQPAEHKQAANTITNNTNRKPARNFSSSYECFPENNADSKILDPKALRLRIEMISDEYLMKERIYDYNTFKLNDTVVSCKDGSVTEDGSTTYCKYTDPSGQTKFPFEARGKKADLYLNIGVSTSLVDDIPNKLPTAIYLGKLVSGSTQEVVVCHLVSE